MEKQTNQGSYNTYIGARYVPIFSGAWDKTKTYEPLVIVEYQGNSYTSKTYVPVGVEIDNEAYWALTGNYNAQVEAYRQQVQKLQNDVNTWGGKIATNTSNISDVSDASYLQKTKSFAFFGDSLTMSQLPEGFANPTFPQSFANIVKANNIVNKGEGGTTFCDSTVIPESFRNKAFVRRMKLESVADYDTVFIMYGTNDYGYAVPLGQEHDTNTETFYGAVNTAIQYMCKEYPRKEIIFISPPYSDTYRTKNSVGLTMLEYFSALKSRCSFYNIPVFDMGSLLGVNEFNRTSNYWDGLHPNQQTYNKMGSVLAKSYYYKNTVGKDLVSYIMPDVSGVNLVSYDDFNPTGLHVFENLSLDFGITFQMVPTATKNYEDSKRKYYLVKDEWYTVSMSVKATQENQRIQWSFYQLPEPTTFTSFVPKLGEYRYVFTFKAQTTGSSVLQIAWEKSNTSNVYVSDLSFCVGKTPLTHTSATKSTSSVYPVEITNNKVQTDSAENTKWSIMYNPQTQQASFTGNVRMLNGITSNDLGTINQVFRPANTQYRPVLLEDGSDIKDAWIAITTAGKISVIGTISITSDKQLIHLDGITWTVGSHEFPGGADAMPV